MKNKMKIKISRLILVLFAAILCFASVACSQEPPVPEIHNTSVIRPRIFEYGNFVYYGMQNIYRCNTVTCEIESACLDPECEGKCPLHGGMSTLGAIEDGKLFFYSYEAFTHNIHFAYQDLISGEVTILKTLSQNEFAGDVNFVNNGYFYYYAGILREGGDEKNPDDYEARLCRIPTSGGDQEILDAPGGSAKMIVDEKLIIVNDGITVYDLESGLEKKLWSCKGNGYYYIDQLTYLGGKLYFLAYVTDTEAEKMESEYKGSYPKNSFLVSVDINSGEWKKVIEEEVFAFTVTDDRIYYSPFKLRHLYVPENYQNNANDVVVSMIDSTLYSCNHDGGDIKAVFNNEIISSYYDFTVIDGRLHGMMSLYDESKHDTTRLLFCSVDLATGEVLASYDIRN